MEITLESLVGKHTLSGAYFDSVKERLWSNGPFENCQVLRFTLDKKYYEAVKDPSDGYRSTLGKLRPTKVAPKNTFKAVKVMARMSQENDCEVLQIVNSKTDKIIIEIGTSDASDYYPGFVGYFSPENL